MADFILIAAAEGFSYIICARITLSDAMIPLLIFSIVGYGLLSHHNVYDDFIKGAKDGFQTVIGIMPTLIGLMVGVGILEA